MNDWKSEIEQALCDFITVVRLTGTQISRGNMVVEYIEAPHKPPSGLPHGKMAIYGFWHEGEWLKIGMVGPKSKARYTSQHYNPGSARSTLAKSLLKDKDSPYAISSNGDTIGDWIKQKCNRVNILIDYKFNLKLIALLEAFLHVRLKPRYDYKKQ